MTSEVSKDAAVGTGVCGVLLLICGVGCMIPGFILIGNNVSSADGLWSGALLLIAGVLGVVTWWKRNRGVITGFLIIAIIAIVALFIQSIIAGVIYSSYKEKARNCYVKDSRCYCGYGFSSYGGAPSNNLYCNKSKMDTIIASLLAIIIFTVIGGIVSFTGSIFGCMGTCSNQTQPGTVIVQRPVIVTTTTLPGYQAQPGYSIQQPGYFVQQPGYPAQQPGYSAQQPGYSAQQPDHQVPLSDYQALQPGHQALQPGHQAPQPGHQAPQPGHQAPQPGHQTPQSDYQALQPDYLDLQPGHQAPESDYQALQPGRQAPESHYEAISSYQAPGPAYADPQATGSYQQQVSDDPPPVYTKHAL